MGFFPECSTLQIHRVSYVGADSQLPFKHPFLHQVLHPADLHLIHIVHEAGPIRTHVCALRGLGLAGGGVVVSGRHAVAAVADAKAPETRRDAGSREGSPAALARHRPVVPMDLLVVNTVREEHKNMLCVVLHKQLQCFQYYIGGRICAYH